MHQVLSRLQVAEASLSGITKAADGLLKTGDQITKELEQGAVALDCDPRSNSSSSHSNTSNNPRMSGIGATPDRRAHAPTRPTVLTSTNPTSQPGTSNKTTRNPRRSQDTKTCRRSTKLLQQEQRGGNVNNKGSVEAGMLEEDSDDHDNQGNRNDDCNANGDANGTTDDQSILINPTTLTHMTPRGIRPPKLLIKQSSRTTMQAIKAQAKQGESGQTGAEDFEPLVTPHKEGKKQGSEREDRDDGGIPIKLATPSRYQLFAQAEKFLGLSPTLAKYLTRVFDDDDDLREEKAETGKPSKMSKKSGVKSGRNVKTRDLPRPQEHLSLWDDGRKAKGRCDDVSDTGDIDEDQIGPGDDMDSNSDEGLMKSTRRRLQNTSYSPPHCVHKKTSSHRPKFGGDDDHNDSDDDSGNSSGSASESPVTKSLPSGRISSSHSSSSSLFAKAISAEDALQRMIELVTCAFSGPHETSSLSLSSTSSSSSINPSAALLPIVTSAILNNPTSIPAVVNLLSRSYDMSADQHTPSSITSTPRPTSPPSPPSPSSSLTPPKQVRLFANLTDDDAKALGIDAQTMAQARAWAALHTTKSNPSYLAKTNRSTSSADVTMLPPVENVTNLLLGVTRFFNDCVVDVEDRTHRLSEAALGAKKMLNLVKTEGLRGMFMRLVQRYGEVLERHDIEKAKLERDVTRLTDAMSTASQVAAEAERERRLMEETLNNEIAKNQVRG